MTKRIKDETDADARCSKYVRCLVSGFKLEKLFQKIYTDTKFQEIQTEYARSKQEKITDRRRLYSVTYNAETKEVACDCRKIETFRILCKQCIHILDQNHVFEIPQKYILDRWRKDVIRRHTRVKVSYYDPTETVECRRFNRMMTKFECVCDEASTIDDATCDMVLERLNQLSNDVRKARIAFQENQNPPDMPNRNIPISVIGSNTAAANVTPPSVKKIYCKRQGCTY
ncbi:protein FAR1-RELATED SEQUENCE 1-like [Chenopodium quinoa]|uniref:protein FAR1-RELATED SEQUENCE 1-like n=1 Tax=Chenopodium quinoa TaxID=63459 RepID=UPI000B76E456|nr:protein FAR1-RELATED SEQUENCE 1-like [Chenopodium quinoa]